MFYGFIKKGEDVMGKLFLIIFLMLFLFAGLISLCLAGTVTLEWDANTEANLNGYHLYRAEKIGNCTTAWERIATVEKNETTYVDEIDEKNYAYQITAFDITDKESFVSNMVERYDRTPYPSVQNLRKQ